jgi:hypothetical protein
MTRIDYDKVERLQAAARRERSLHMYRLLIAPLLKLFERPAKPRASRMIRRHTAFG